jgi:cytochrome bd-type quinol oxidase subunit 2
MRSFVFGILLTGVLLSFVPTMVVRAEGSGLSADIQNQLGAAGSKTGLTNQDPREVVGKIIKVVLSLLGMVFTVLLVYAGYLWMTAGGEEEPITKAKSIIRNSIIGLLVVLTAYAVTQFVLKGLIQSSKVDNTPMPPSSWLPQGSNSGNV